MRGTKIMALRLGEIIKTLLFVVVGIALIILLISLFTSRSGKESKEATLYNPGAYKVNLQLSKGSVDIEVVVTSDKITGISFKELPEDQEVFYPLFKPTMEILSTEILENQNLNVKVPEDRLVTGSVLLSAIDEALLQARAK